MLVGLAGGVPGGGPGPLAVPPEWPRVRRAGAGRGGGHGAGSALRRGREGSGFGADSRANILAGTLGTVWPFPAQNANGLGAG